VKIPVTALRLFAAVCVGLGVVPLANLLTGGAAVPWWGQAVAEWKVRGLVVLAIAAGLAVVLGSRVDSGLARARALLLRPPPRTFALLMAVLTFAAAAFLARYCFAGQPFTTDEMAQQWHARILLSGHLSAVPEAHREFFNTAPVIDRDGRWFSQYPVGGPALIALGLLFGAAWLVNPLLIAFATWNLYGFVAAAFDDLTARITTLLFALSPMVLIMAASQMNHVPALSFTLLALASLAEWDRTDDPRRQRRHAAVVGLALGLVALVRPLDAAVVGAVVLGFEALRARESRERRRSLLAQLAACAVPVALLLWVNSRTTGSPFLFGYEALNGPEHGLGFHVDPTGRMHTPVHGLVLISGYLMRLSRYLFEWPLPGVPVIVAGLVALSRPSRWDVVLTALAAGFLGAYAAYWFDGFFAGPRFLFTAVPAFVYFAARAPGAVAAAVRQPIARRAILLIAPLCVLATWLGPYGVSSARARIALFVDQRTKLKTDVEAQVERAGLRNALVFVNEGWRGRLLARLRVLGVPQFRADAIASGVDACGLETALDAEDSLSGADAERAARVVGRAQAMGEARPVEGLPADRTIALVPGSAPTPACLGEFQRDTSGTMPYPLFLVRQRVGRDGRVGGEVVFARDLGHHNELLRDRFGGRAWYRYRPGSGLQDTTTVFVPYEEGGR
jgi:4-amino-4-deoxy-L-arabinose transferase-like glycosyltransferase